ncbi:hypothetical protein P4H39_29595 [Paenibacillus lautus]|jgi:hypothetical protein|uniref:hypothetical protein n=1 Tax=Paenibacillus lautus TaxID=1401 RepID=UPI002DC0005D|nr:hypothetical protein [Paenibacillus lautus]MEC0206767.1 hypothetical protein [Paenibacillus lautus]
MTKDKQLTKLIRLTGERARLEAKANGTYVVYKDDYGKLIREYSNGEKEYVSEKDS